MGRGGGHGGQTQTCCPELTKNLGPRSESSRAVVVRTQAFEREICQVERLEDGGILGNERKRNLVGHTPVKREEFRKKNSGLGEGTLRLEGWKKPEKKVGQAGSLESKDTATQGPWRKKAESEAGGIPGPRGFDGRTKVRAGLRMLCLGVRKQESGQGSSGS